MCESVVQDGFAECLRCGGHERSGLGVVDDRQTLILDDLVTPAVTVGSAAISRTCQRPHALPDGFFDVQDVDDPFVARRYQVRYRTPQRTQTKKRGFQTKRDAQEFAATVEVDKLTGTYVAPKLGTITVGEMAPAWLSRKQTDVAPSNYRTLEAAWRNRVQPVWGTTRLADVDLGEVERWIAAVRKTSGPTTVIRAYGVLAGILDDAVKSRRLASNPLGGWRTYRADTASDTSTFPPRMWAG